MSLQNVFYVLAIVNLSLWLIFAIFCLMVLISIVKKKKKIEGKVEEAKELLDFSQLKTIKNLIFVSSVTGLVVKAFKSLTNKDK